MSSTLVGFDPKMSETLPKYQIIESSSLHDVRQGIGEYTTLGYKLHTFTVLELFDGRDKLPQYIAVMSLSSAKYDDIKGLRDVPPGEANKLLSEGWIVADSYSKFIRMVKKK